MRLLPLTVVLLATLLGSAGRAQPLRLRAPGEVAAAEPELGPCVSDEEVRAAQPAERWKAFRRSPVPIPPLLYLSQDRTFVEALLLYWSSTNVAERSRQRLLVPLLYTACTPRSRTLVTPLYGHRVDPAGKAGFVGSYFFRRDRTAQSDVLFPLFARIVDEQRHTVIGLNFYHHRTREGSHGGFVPLAFWGGSRDGSRYAYVPPLVFHRGGAESTTTLVLNSYLKVHRRGGYDFGLWPLYFMGRHRDAAYDVVPPALFARWGDRDTTSWWWLNTYSTVDRSGWRFGSFPFYFGDVGLRHHFHAVLPPLFIHWGDDRHESTLVGNAYFTRARRSRDYGLIPLYFGGRDAATGSYYDVALPFLVRHGDRRRATTFALLYYATREGERRHFGVFPFYLGGRGLDRGGSYDAVLPPLLIRASDRYESTLWAGLVYHHRTHWERQTHVLPLFYRGRDVQRETYYDVLLPLYARFGDRASQTTVLGPGYVHTRPGHWAAGLVPLVFAGADARARSSYLAVLPPVFAHWRDAGSESTLALAYFDARRPHSRTRALIPLWVEHREADRLTRAVTPLFWQWGDAAAQRTLLFPLVFHERRGTSRLFLAPLIVSHVDTALDVRRLVLFPLWWRFQGRDGDVNVGFPLWWDFQARRRGTRLSIFLPFGFRRDTADETTTMVLNVLYTRGKGGYADAWSFYLFPLVEVASYNAQHLKWQLLLGLVGHERQGRLARWRVGYFWTDPS
jgi:hypothetical protein